MRVKVGLRSQILPPVLYPAPRSSPPLTFPSIFGDDSEGGWLVDRAMAQTWPVGTDMTAVDGIHVELQGAPWGQADGGARSADMSQQALC